MTRNAKTYGIPASAPGGEGFPFMPFLGVDFLMKNSSNNLHISELFFILSLSHRQTLRALIYSPVRYVLLQSFVSCFSVLSILLFARRKRSIPHHPECMGGFFARRASGAGAASGCMKPVARPCKIGTQKEPAFRFHRKTSRFRIMVAPPYSFGYVFVHLSFVPVSYCTRITKSVMYGNRW